MEIPTKVTNDGKLVLLIGSEEKTVGDIGELENVKKNLDLQAPRNGLADDKKFFADAIVELKKKNNPVEV